MPQRHGAHNMDIYEPLDSGSGRPMAAGASTDGSSRGRRCRCINSNGRCFNSVVALMLCANTALIALEADLGVLGSGSPQWTGLRNDMDIVGLPMEDEARVKESLQRGIEADSTLKARLQEQIHTRTHASIDIEGGLSLGKGSAHLKFGAYTVCEFFFATFFFLELLLRVCEFGGSRGFCGDRWNLFDAVLAVSGVLDVMLPFVFLGPGASPMALTLLSCLRMTRTFRVLRLFRVCSELKSTVRGFATAFATVLWIGVVVAIVNFVLASLLTSMLGQEAHLWEDQAGQIRDWFGSVGLSMQTLFGVMTLSGWEELATVLSRVIPAPIVGLSIVGYLMMCFFTTLSLVTSLVNQSFALAHRTEEQQRTHAIEEFRVYFSGALANVFSSSDQSQRGHLEREEYRAILESHPAVFPQLKRLGIEATSNDLMQLFDRLCKDAPIRGAVAIDALVEAIVHMNCPAGSSEVFDIKYAMTAMRREMHGQMAALKQEVLTQRNEGTKQALTAHGELQKQLGAVLQALDALRQKATGLGEDIAQIGSRLDQFERRSDGEFGELKRDMTAMRALTGQKIDTLSAQVVSFAGISMKLDALSAHLVSQPKLEESLDRISEKLSSHLSAKLCDVAPWEATGPPRRHERGGDAMEPESTHHSVEDGSPNCKDPEVVACGAATVAEPAVSAPDITAAAAAPPDADAGGAAVAEAPAGAEGT